MTDALRIKKTSEIYPIRDDLPDDLFITCGSFEERFLAAPKIFKSEAFNEFILFKFEEPNERREELIKEMEGILSLENYEEKYYKILCEHGKSMNGMMEFNENLQEINVGSKDLFITVDISTFTKDLLSNLILYLFNFSSVKKLRLLYTPPERYTSPEEDWLSFGINAIHIPPMSWNAWSPLKENLLIIILGFEEMRAWSLIDKSFAEEYWLFVTKPGTISEWDNYCAKYNERLLKKVLPKGNIPAFNPYETSKEIYQYVKDAITKYNIFICPLGTKPQLIGILHLITAKSLPLNLLTTTVVHHNVPYYSSGMLDTYEFYFPVRGNQYG